MCGHIHAWINIFHRLYFKFVPRKYRFLKLKYAVVLLFLFILLIQITLFGGLKYYKIFTTPTPPFNVIHTVTLDSHSKITQNTSLITLKIPSLSEFRQSIVSNKLKKLIKLSDQWDIKQLLKNVPYPISPCKKVHIFYQISFSNQKIDGQWNIWNQEYNSGELLKDDDPKFNLQNLKLPPDDIDSNFYPLLGCYSSRDPEIIKIHLKEIRDTGIGVLILPWKSDKTTEDSIDIIFNLAKDSQLKIAFHVSTSSDQKPDTILKNIQHLTTKYTYRQVYYKFLKNGRNLPVYYVFESYLTPALVWRQLLAPGTNSIRGTPYDGVFIGLLRDSNHMYEIGRAHFDGFYTYYSSNGFSYGSSWKNWKSLTNYAKKYKLLFFPSVSPGYSARSSQVGQTRHRSAGRYYQVAWRAALSAGASGVSITSFNDWQHGSQIEPAVPKPTYLDYRPHGPYFYLNLTRYWIDQFVFYDKQTQL